MGFAPALTSTVERRVPDKTKVLPTNRCSSTAGLTASPDLLAEEAAHLVRLLLPLRLHRAIEQALAEWHQELRALRLRHGRVVQHEALVQHHLRPVRAAIQQLKALVLHLHQELLVRAVIV